MSLPDHATTTTRAARRRRRRSATPSLIVGLALSTVLHALVLQGGFRVVLHEPRSLQLEGLEMVSGESALRVIQIATGDTRLRYEASDMSSQPQPGPSLATGMNEIRPIRAIERRLSAEPVSLRQRLRSTIPITPAENRMLGEAPLDVPRERIARSLHLFNDSVAKAEEAARAARDWTRTNEHGERWGISVARLNLGKYTIPLQYDTTEDVFRAPLHRREEQQRRVLLFEETERQVVRAEIDAQIRASLLEIRARSDAKRDSIRGRDRDE